MDRCALFVDAGYLLADGAMAVHGTRHREAVAWDYPGLLKLLTGLSRERTGLPLLRCYWYEATVEGRRTPEHDVLADIPGLKLRLARIRPGRREGVDAQAHRDLMTLARNNAICDAVVVSGDEDLAQVVSDAQDLGIRVTVMQIAADSAWAASRTLRQECDDLIEIGGGQLRPYVTMITSVDPGGLPSGNGQHRHQQPASNGQAHGNSAVPHVNGASEGDRSAGSARTRSSQPALPAQPSAPPQLPPAPPPGPSQPAAPARSSGSGQPSGAAPSESAPFGSAQSGGYALPPGSGPPSGSVPPSGPAQSSSAQSSPAQSSSAQYPAAQYPSAQPPATQSPPTRSSTSGPTPAQSSSSDHPGLAEPLSLPPPSQPQPQRARRQPQSTPQPQVPPSHTASSQSASSQSAPSHNAPSHGAPPHGVTSQGASSQGVQPQTPASAPSHQYGSGSGGYSPVLGPYTGPHPAPIPSTPPQPGTTTTLAEAVQAAHKEGHDFGESVARDAPALWLEAVLARKPRMPSDLEARLLQGSSLPIDFLLHDEVRHALRRGFWDALERARY
ncbi:NYN domain-containing protein [Sphaerimonospora sp. CA-214678]|uniref:NYN domain-containing protein n=1 Tax=Sphaerimonospora sp. CA-214678 TaxID=3240029 RepID=UPI003D9292F1